MKSARPRKAGPDSDGADRDIREKISTAAGKDTGSDRDAKRRPSTGPTAASTPSGQSRASDVKVAREVAGEIVAGEIPAGATTPITAAPTPKAAVHPVAKSAPETAGPQAAGDAAGKPAPTEMPRAKLVSESMTTRFAPPANTVPTTSPAASNILAYARRQPGSEADADSLVAPDNLPDENAAASANSTGILDQVKDLIEIAFPLTPPLLPPLSINVNNGRAEYLSVDIPDGKFIFYIGALSGVSTEAFYVLNNHVDADIDDNDVPQLLEELLTGDTGGLGDDESEPGLEGFQLISLTPDSYSLAIADGERVRITDLVDHLPTNVLALGLLPGLLERILEPTFVPRQVLGGETYDILTLQGPGMPDLIAGLDRDLTLSDGINQFGLINLDAEAVPTGGDPIDTAEGAAALLTAALDRADLSVQLLGVEEDSISVVVNEVGSPAFDYLVLTGQTVSSAVDLVETDAVDPTNGVSELVIATGDASNVIAVGGDVFDGFLVRDLGSKVTEDELESLLRSLARRPGVNAVDQGDTVRFEIRGADGSVDVIVFETDQAPGNGAFDVGFRRAQLRDEVRGLLSDLRERPLATIVEQVQFTLSDVLNFAFSVPALRALFEAIAPGINVADADPLTEEPVIDVANGISETASLAIPTGEFVFEIGDTFAVGTNGGLSFFSFFTGLPISELSGILRAEVDADDNDNDAQQLLEEILSGRSGAVLDFETEPGIDGVTLVGLTPQSFTLAFADGEETDRLTLEGPGARAILAAFDARGGADLADGENNLSLIDVGSDSLELGDGPNNPIFDVVGSDFAGDADLAALIAAATGGTSAAVTMISQDPGSISVLVDNATTGESDLLVFFDPTDATDLL